MSSVRRRCGRSGKKQKRIKEFTRSFIQAAEWMGLKIDKHNKIHGIGKQTKEKRK